MSCVRQAWLVLGSRIVQLEDPTQGYFCDTLDLGWPEVREVTNNRPDQDGTDDRTAYFGSRAVSATIHAVASAGGPMSIDGAASLFAPFMSPAVRPVLHYILDRPGAAERVMTLRAAGYAWPISGADEREIQLQWVAPDPIAYDARGQSATAWAGSVGGGRVYNLGFNRIYPAGGSGGSSAIVVSNGDLPVRPIVTLYGPISGPVIAWNQSNPTLAGQLRFQPSYVLNAGQYIIIDTRARTVRLAGTTSVLNQVDWYNSTWPLIQPAPASSTWTLSGTNTSGSTQILIAWSDAYLT